MDMKIKRYCAVSGCGSCSDRVKLYKFPKGQALSSMWKKVLGSYCLSLKVNRSSYQIWICERHFEAKYIMPNGRRHYCAIPTLFTASEIAAGAPRNPITIEWEHDKQIIEASSTSGALKRSLTMREQRSNLGRNASMRRCEKYGLSQSTNQPSQYSTSAISDIDPSFRLKNVIYLLFFTKNKLQSMQYSLF